ncbi:conserved hypothetical protein [Beutenbergia cavernae DSM 12333]|uniref:YbaB/EbfC DNA-binding family protein n=1 Tax=Beutenbergia cavernae (strain ATCC BAA-8 / DSM 12333 / CCUG 43141 / JCM 11478 / NBRC 16432 / NCIMB 13614 / HKI 0122) TaxID=471853 RepID=C5C0P5_BEUC1|nr:hypothetical protein [Beutenbergia cavernae]ACQ81441.1 conserved hypothetical protein [Beutenbergia cavernae DSM 12333]
MSAAPPAGSWRDGYEASLAHIEALADISRRRVTAIDRVQAELERTVVEGWSPRRDVRVELDSAGLIRDVEFTEAAPASSPLALGRSVGAAHAAALAELQRRVDALAERELDEGDPLRASLVTTYRDTVGRRLAELEQ